MDQRHTGAKTEAENAAQDLPPRFRDWFAARGWQPRPHQLELLRLARSGRSALLVAPTGAGKTLAGFLPTLVELAQGAPMAAASSPPPAERRGGSGWGAPGPGREAQDDERIASSDRPPPLAPPRRKRGEGERSIHTLYISPLKALAVDIARNLETPVAEMGLGLRIETRTGDASAHKRTRQIERPPDILLTTPEQLALLIAHREARSLFGGLKRIVLDELHALVTSKRGDLLALGLARLRTIAGPDLTMVGLSATVREPEALALYLVGSSIVPDVIPGQSAEGAQGKGIQQRESSARPRTANTPPGSPSLASLAGDDTGSTNPPAAIVVAPPGAPAELTVLDAEAALPLAGHTARHAMAEVYDAIRRHKTTLVFVNTRLHAEYVFQELWRINEDGLPIALHHGSLDASQRRKVEAAMAEGRLRGVVCTSTLDLGIDWGDVDLVVNIGAPKGASRLMQRIGRANHRLDEPSRAFLVPANRFEMLECRAALDAVAEAAQDTPEPRVGALDVLAQHVLGMACAEPFDALALYDEVRSAAPYRDLTWEDFEAVVDFVATGGYALRAYERFAKIRRGPDGLWRVTDARTAQHYRMNVGTIIEADMLKVRLGRVMNRKPGAPGTVMRGGRVLGEVEEYFAEGLTAGDTFVFGGEVLRFEGIIENEVRVTRATAADPKVPSYAGGKFPLSTFLAARVRAMIADPSSWSVLPAEVAGWLARQQDRSILPGRDELLVETFERAGRHYLVAYPFEGRLAHQTLGMLLTRRLERARLKPLGFVANDYGLAVWGLSDISAAISGGRLSIDALFGPDMLGDDLEEWLEESALMKRTFRHCAIISGLIEKRFPGQEKTGRQVTMSTDLVYDVLRRHEPGHILMKAARADAATGLLDIRRLSDMLARIRGRIVHQALPHVSPLSVAIILEIGREAVYGEASDAILAEAEAQLMEEALS